jgi:hypothetical protein
MSLTKLVATQLILVGVLGIIVMYVVFGVTPSLPPTNVPNEIVVLTPRLHIRSDTQHGTLQTWIVEDSKTGCEYLIVRDEFSHHSLTSTPLVASCQK